MASVIARVYNEGLGALPPVGAGAKPLVRGLGRSPLEADEIFVV